MNANSKKESTIRVMLGGDVMLGRNVREYMQRYGANYPLSRVATLMREADLTIVNLECALTEAEKEWSGVPKAFYFRATPQAVHGLLDAGVDMLSLANNHILDFGPEGLIETLHHLDEHGIRHAGAGVDIDDARNPAIISCNGMKFGMSSFCDHQADFAAETDRPGIAYLDFDDEPHVILSLRQALDVLQRAKVDWPILALHWGPNMVCRPSAQIRRIARAAVDMGWKILFGHSAHVFQGIEIYNGCPIIYAAGDLVDDYYVDPLFKNDHQMLFELELSRTSLTGIRLHPTLIVDCRAQLATGNEFEYIAKWIAVLCREMGTIVQRKDDKLWIDCT